MPHNIPSEIQEQIMRWLPIKSLLQFRMVSKEWKSTIDSFAFIHSYQHTQMQPHILIRNRGDQNYVSVADDDTFPHQKVSLVLPESAQQLDDPILLGSSEGLFCLYGYTVSGKKTAVIWNPTIRKSVDILLPDVLNTKNGYDTSVGFGVCPDSLDPILVNITMEYSSEVIESTTRITWLAQVFRLSSGAWKSLFVNMIQSTTALHDEADQVAIDSEEFTEIHLPIDLVSNLDMEVYICKLKESLDVLHFDCEVDAPDYHVWMMENGDKKSFKKIYTIMGNSLVASVEGVYGSRKSGEPIIAMIDQSEEEDYEVFQDEENYELFAYEPNSGQVKHIGISARGSSFFVSPYTATLLLHNH